MAIKWSKKLSKSDAQRKTLGAKMPFLRFTKGSVPHAHETWFRDTFFDNLNWQQVAKKPLGFEEARVRIHVIIDGDDLGTRQMRIDHDPSRAGNHNAPLTHLHYDNATRQALESHNYHGYRVVVTRDDADRYKLEVIP